MINRWTKKLMAAGLTLCLVCGSFLPSCNILVDVPGAYVDVSSDGVIVEYPGGMVEVDTAGVVVEFPCGYVEVGGGVDVDVDCP